MASAQIQTPATPSPGRFKPVGVDGNETNESFSHMSPRKQVDLAHIQKENHNQLAQVEKVIEENRSERVEVSMKSRFPFANTGHAYYKQAIGFYEQAYGELSAMLDGKKPLNLKRAIYMAENVIEKGNIGYADYLKTIDGLLAVARYVGKQEGMDLSNDVAAHYTIQKLFTDTIRNKETGAVVPPIGYDFEDYGGKLDRRNLLVTKLLEEGKGQCRSLPLLYLILAEELDTQTYLSFSPNHSYIKFRGANGTIYNFETTNGNITTDAWVVGSGFVKSQAIKSGIFLDTLNKKQVIAHLLGELATSYREEFGYGEFMLKCFEASTEYYPNDIHAQLEMSNLITALCDREFAKYGYPGIDKAKRDYPMAYALYERREDIYNNIDALGWTTMPKSAYDRWLKMVDAKRAEQQQERQQLNLEGIE